MGAINDEIAAWQDEIAAAQARLQASASASPGYHIYASSFAQNIDVMHEVSQDTQDAFFDLPLNATVDFDRLLYINDKHQHEWTLGPLQCQPARCPASEYLFGFSSSMGTPATRPREYLI